jgi:hypothetical protein
MIRRSTLAPRGARAKTWMSGRRKVALVFGVVALAAFSAFTAEAQACTPDGAPPSRWYGVGRDYSVTQNNGLFSDIYVSSSGVADWQLGGHINETIWESVANSTNVTYWVEGGWTHGYRGLSGRYFYWARNTPANGYADHRVGNRTPTVGTYEPVEVLYGGSNYWHVYFNWVKATSPDGSVADIYAGPYSRGYQFGLESTSSQNYTAAPRLLICSTSTREARGQTASMPARPSTVIRLRTRTG